MTRRVRKPKPFDAGKFREVLSSILRVHIYKTPSNPKQERWGRRPSKCLWWRWYLRASASIREMRTSTIKGFLIESSIVEVAYLPSLLAEWELKSPVGKYPVRNE